MRPYSLIPIKERSRYFRCWFCGTDTSVKYYAKFINPNLNSDKRFIDITVCNKCALLHSNHLLPSDHFKNR